jgi:hypothetical protein
MTISRYDGRAKILNTANSYRSSAIFRKRGAIQINHYATPILKQPSPEDMAGIERNTRIWETGTKYFNLAYEFYGDPEYWWVIAWFNFSPLETNFKPGDVVVIPTPLETVLSGFGLL